MKQIDNTIIAEDGMVFRRIADGSIYGKEIVLGYTYYIGGNLLTVPHKDEPSDFEEIEEPTDYEDVSQVVYLSDIEIAQRDKLNEIHKYDTSSNVNIFYYQGNPYWIDKTTRVGLVNSTKMEIELGRTTTTLILDEVVVNLQCTDLLMMLAQLEVYAKDCYNVTANHVINVKRLTDIEAIEQYDYTVGYPTKLQF